MDSKQKAKLVTLVILDGWGIAAPGPGNAISQARTINMTSYQASYPHSQLAAAGENVGLPRGEAGNTETGHLNLGAGRIVYQDLARINMAIADGTFYTNEVLVGAFNHAKKFNSAVHLMGLVGAGGVHSNLEHLFALLAMAKMQNFQTVFIHAFTDGRDSPPTAGATYFQKIKDVITRNGIGQVASLMGRYWAMDRDRRWDRTQRAYQALTQGIGNLVKTPEEVLEASYQNGITDEFVEPAVLADQAGKPLGIIKDNDAVVFFNFRIDRPRQLASAFVYRDFSQAPGSWDFDPYATKYGEKLSEPRKNHVNGDPFVRGKVLGNLYFVTMTQYSRSLVKYGAKIAFPPETVDNPLGRVISDTGLRQLRVAETEKERFVTFYFNGQQETAYPGEERVIIPSPRVPTYDQKPQMSARELTETVIDKIRNGGHYNFILVNFANADMVGHTGSIGPAVTACEVVDECLGKIVNSVLAYDGVVVVTADHGNAEEMINASTGQIETEHSSNPVPFIVISKDFLGKALNLPSGILADVAPTLLGLLGIQKPSSMTGRNLLEGVS